MARLNVNPTRMELTRLKTRLKTAEKGYKMLKDKSDEMIRQFMSLVKENIRLREEVESELQQALASFVMARAVSDEATIEEAFQLPSTEIKLDISERNLMSVNVPVISISETDSGNLYPYSFLSVTTELDLAVEKMDALKEKLIKLAEIEKTCNLLADEIEKNRRRVNALEYRTIPDSKETIKYITMKLDENERSATIRLMKVKSKIDN